MVAAGEAAKNLTIRSPQSGYVVEKKIVVGASVEPKMTFFEIADLSSVLIEAEVYERDLAFLSPGQAVEAKVEAWPQRTFRGELVAIYPQMDMAMQTNRVRVRLGNARGELRPGMYAHVLIDTPLETVEPYKSLAVQPPPVPSGDGKAVEANSLAPTASAGASPSSRTSNSSGLTADKGPATASAGASPSPSASNPSGLAADKGPATASAGASPSSPPIPEGKLFLVVPESAVIDTGDEKIVYIERAEGQYEGHEVELGPRHDGFFPVLKGLKAGDKVAAAGGFLVDAETRLNPAVASTYFGASGGQTLVSSPSGGKIAGVDWLKGGQLPGLSDRDLKNIAQLPKVDCPGAMFQRVCPVTGFTLGSMGVPIRITLRGKTLFLCCKGCIAKARRAPQETLRKLQGIIELARQLDNVGCTASVWPSGPPAAKADGSPSAPSTTTRSANSARP